MEFVGDIARKTGDPALLAIEAEKSHRAAAIGRDSGLFRVPEIRAFDPDSGQLDCERIADLVTFSEFARTDRDAVVALAERAGNALARIHADLRLPEAMQIPLPAEWAIEGAESVCLHGDFTANNVCVDLVEGELVIVDWSAAPTVGRRATIGPRSFDVLMFVRHVLLGTPSTQVFGLPGPTICDRFVSGYVAGSGSPIHRDSWNAYHAKFGSEVGRILGRRVAASSFLMRPLKALAQGRLRKSWRGYTPPTGSLI